MPRTTSLKTSSSSLFRQIVSCVLLGVAFLLANTALADDWPQWLGPKRDGVWRETGVVEKFSKDGPKVRWKHEIGAGYAGPAVADGRVYVFDRVLEKGVKNPGNPFSKEKVKGVERIVCLNDKDGQELWKYEYPCDYQISYASGPRTTPIIQDGKLFALGAMGDLFCLDAKDGKVVWSKKLTEEFNCPVPLWGFSASPLLDGDRLITLVGGKDHVVMAFNKDTGKEIWHALSANEPGYCPPIIVEAGGKRQLIIWHPESVNGLDPETGKQYWSEKLHVQAGMAIPTPRVEDGKLFVSGFYCGSMMMKLNSDKPSEELLWKEKGRDERPENTKALHAVMCTPFLRDGYIYGVCSYGQLRCLKADTGERVWETLKATGDVKEPTERWANAFLVPNGDRFFIANEKGDLIIAKLTPQGYDEISRAHILDPTTNSGAFATANRSIVWSHPAFGNKSFYARNDKEIVCVSLAAE
jgi:outer membrane protein assembly factor BamB